MFEYVRQTWLVVALAVVLGGVLASVDRALQPRIDAHARDRLQTAVLQVVPSGVNAEQVMLDNLTLYRVTSREHQLCGWAVELEGKGFVDTIRALVGLSADGQSIVGLTVLSSRETPGLGDRIRDPRFTDQFVGQSSEGTTSVTKSATSATGSIHAITGATISSRAVTDAVNAGVVAARLAIERYASERPESKRRWQDRASQP